MKLKVKHVLWHRNNGDWISFALRCPETENVWDLSITSWLNHNLLFVVVTFLVAIWVSNWSWLLVH